MNNSNNLCLKQLKILRLNLYPYDKFRWEKCFEIKSNLSFHPLFTK